jgi:isopropylmalate/homocitrate/citramalate synthase
LFKNIVGVLTAKAINIHINKNTWLVYSKSNLNKTSKSVLPIIEDVLKIDNNKNKEPHTVYKKR